MPLTKEELLQKMAGSGVAYSVHEHTNVLTSDAQAEALADSPGTVTKNLFLKDKKNRLYIITALTSTKVDLKVLSSRLGLGKGGIQMAPENLLLDVLQVGKGCVTPLAVANPEAANVLLLLDQHIKSQEVVFVHPLVNNVSLGLSPAALDAALRCLGREPIYVDLEIEPKIDRENPPDLKKYADSVEATTPAAADTAVAPTATTAASPAAAKAPATKPAEQVKKSKDSSKAAKQPSSAAVHQQLTNTQLRVEDILEKAAHALLGTSLEQAKLDPYTRRRLAADVEMQLNALKNAAYTSGYIAGKSELIGHADKRFA